VTTDTWYHIAGVRHGNTLTIYVDGVAKGTKDVTGVSIVDTGNVLRIGGQVANSQYFNGWIDDIRITKSARYTDDFNFPTKALPDSRFAVDREPTILDPYWDDVVALLHFNNASGSTVIDDVIGGFSWSAVSSAQQSDVKVEYGAGSLILDGVADHITAGTAADWKFLTDGSVDYTLEVSVYIDAAGQHTVFDNGGGTSSQVGIFFRIETDGSVNFSITRGVGATWAIAGFVSAAGVIRATTWHKLSVVVDVSVGAKIYVDEVEVAAGVNGSSRSTSNPHSPLWVGAWTSNSTTDFDGYMDELRITKAARYFADFNPPTEAFPDFEYDPNENTNRTQPLDPHFNDIVMLLYGNGRVGTTTFDDAANPGRFTFGAVADAQIGSKSGAFDSTAIVMDGTGDYITVDADPLLDFFDGVFTFEARLNMVLKNNRIYCSGGTTQGWGAGVNDIHFLITAASSGTISAQFSTSTASAVTVTTSASSWSGGEWIHLAVVVDSDELCTIYINGENAASGSISTRSIVAGAVLNTRLGHMPAEGAGSYLFSGAMEQIRITPVVRYRSDFEPPIAPFPVAVGNSVFTFDKYLVAADRHNINTVSLLNFSDGYNKLPVDPKGQEWVATNDAYLDWFSEAVFDGSGDYLQQTEDADFTDEFDGTNSSNWTIELRYRVGSITAEQILLDWRPDNAAKGLVISQPSANKTNLQVDMGDSTASFEATALSIAEVAVGDEVDVAVTRDGDDYLLHVNGVYQAKGTTAVTLDLGTGGVRLGSDRNATPGSSLLGEIIRVRFTKQVSRYAEDENYILDRDEYLTVEADSNFPSVQLLLSGGEVDGSTTFVDAMGNAPSNIVGDPAYSNVLSRFVDTSIRMEADRIDYDSFTLGSVFTIETFFNLDATVGDQYLFSNTAATDQEFVVYNAAAGPELIFWTDGASRITVTPPAAVTWHHVALTYDGTDFKFWLNGVSLGTYNDPGLSFTDTEFAIGGYTGGSLTMTGYLEDFRVTSGVVRYTADFTPPGRLPKSQYMREIPYPYTASLLHFEGADDDQFTLDEVGEVTWDIVGTADISTAEFKWGGSSYLVADGTNYLRTYDVPAFGTEDFTIECWFKSVSNASTGVLFDIRPDSDNNSAVAFVIYFSAAQNYLRFNTGGVDQIVTSTNTRDTNWHHIALTRHQESTRLFIDGAQEGSTYNPDTASYIVGSNGLIWGNDSSNLAAASIEGHLDDCRITVGQARYVTNFAIPTEAYPDNETVYDFKAKNHL
ncbi:MAG: hypothetical protein DRQ89_13185, partial [Epsilonproteobacteria bacterium]